MEKLVAIIEPSGLSFRGRIVSNDGEPDKIFNELLDSIASQQVWKTVANANQMRQSRPDEKLNLRKNPLRPAEKL
jgi:hypothetical protein